MIRMSLVDGPDVQQNKIHGPRYVDEVPFSSSFNVSICSHRANIYDTETITLQGHLNKLLQHRNT